VIGKINKIKMDATRAITPPNLLGIERRIAYTHRKYHSGLMWIGVDKGFAIRKFSGSVNKLGVYITNNSSAVTAITNPNISLIE
jgi:hypothetical protein